MSKNTKQKKTPELLLRVSTLKGIVYEKYIDFVSVSRKDGIMVINKNYSSVLEQLSDGDIVVHEQSKKVIISATNSWLTVSNNICYIYSAEAKVVSP